MPRAPEWLRERGGELESPSSRFTLSPAVAVGLREDEWQRVGDEEEAREALRRHLGDWVFEEHEELGQGEGKVGGTGRGAEGVTAVLIFIGLHAAAGVISVTVGLAWKRFLERLRSMRQGGEAPRLDVSRGGAAYLAVAEVAERFGEPGPVELEAVEEPSSVAGADVSELSYVGVEPWLVLLRNRERLRRYVVVVAPDGGVVGAMETPMGEWEHMFLPPLGEVRTLAAPRTPRPWWKFWG